MNRPWERINTEEILLLPLIQFPGTISLIQNQDSLIKAIEVLSQYPMIGLDTEKRPTFRKGQNYPLSLLQLATPQEVFLIQLQKTGLPPVLRDFLANENIKKVGIALHDDIKELKKLVHFRPAGFIQLDLLAKEKGIIQTGARSLTAFFLKHRLSKSSQKSNWGRKELTDKQKIYAATDAWICLEIYPHLIAYLPSTSSSCPSSSSSTSSSPSSSTSPSPLQPSAASGKFEAEGS